jgi:hypothetical protein
MLISKLLNLYFTKYLHAATKVAAIYHFCKTYRLNLFLRRYEKLKFPYGEPERSGTQRSQQRVIHGFAHFPVNSFFEALVIFGDWLCQSPPTPTALM